MQKKYLKIMSAALCAAMCTSLVACGSSGDSSSSDSKNTESSDSTPFTVQLLPALQR